ncbi:uncharacterized protein C8A04DRAFT_33341 [Dichotomopilus funicola]|uniref:Uncharacterized protein n=1 Tax=Dichotomopilus funicola TaxID=1934379 RepID=A0AAN6ZIK5_9PEZI|nr:hypothetical protein C8A04DRAFT_33341 [Dichotomopilus funicola]
MNLRLEIINDEATAKAVVELQKDEGARAFLKIIDDVVKAQDQRYNESQTNTEAMQAAANEAAGEMAIPRQMGGPHTLMATSD